MIYLSAIIYTSMISNIQNSINKIKGSSLSLPAYGREGQGQHSLAAHFAKQNTKNCSGGKARAGREFIFPTPLFLPAPSERKNFLLCRAKRGNQNSQSGFSSKKVRILTKRHHQKARGKSRGREVLRQRRTGILARSTKSINIYIYQKYA